MPTPLISAILCCRNAGPDLAAAVESVMGQEAADFELVVVDAASDDGSLGGVRGAAGGRERMRILSEPDSGVYEGMNKGVRLARGEWLYFLGADDRLADARVFADLAPALASTGAGLCSGTSLYADGRLYGSSMTGIARRNFIHHQATFYRRALFARHGGYDETFRVQGDYEFNLRLARAGVRLETCGRLVARCACGGLSDGGSWRNYREEIRARHLHLPAWRCWPWDAGSAVRYVRKQFFVTRAAGLRKPDRGG